jgi:hypothetical protein
MKNVVRPAAWFVLPFANCVSHRRITGAAREGGRRAENAHRRI